MNKNQIFSYLTGSLQQYTMEQMAFNLCVTFVLLLVIFLVYFLTHTANGTFSADFGFTLILTGLVTSTIMMVIESNLALSLGMVGALSIIRFRTAVKDPKDTSFIFWAVATGLSAGTGGYVLAILSSFVIGCFVIVYSLVMRAFPDNLLVVRAGSGVSYNKVLSVLKKSGVRYKLKMKEVSTDAQHMIFRVSGKNVDRLPDMLQSLEDVYSVSLAWEGEN